MNLENDIRKKETKLKSKLIHMEKLKEEMKHVLDSIEKLEEEIRTHKELIEFSKHKH